jgi:hypothetical protein
VRRLHIRTAIEVSDFPFDFVDVVVAVAVRSRLPASRHYPLTGFSTDTSNSKHDRFRLHRRRFIDSNMGRSGFRRVNSRLLTNFTRLHQFHATANSVHLHVFLSTCNKTAKQLPNSLILCNAPRYSKFWIAGKKIKIGYLTGFACNKSSRQASELCDAAEGQRYLLTLCDFLVCIRETRIVRLQERINLSERQSHQHAKTLS